MKPWYRRVFRLAEETPTVEPRFATKVTQLGKTGSRVYAGYPDEEYHHLLQNTRRADTFDEMRRSDPQITMCTSAVKGPIKSGKYEFEAGDDSEQQKLIKEHMEQIFFKDIDFKQLLSEYLTMIEFGHSVFEYTDQIKLNNPKFGSYNSLQSVSWRSPRTITRWIINKENGKLEGIEQQSFGDLDVMVVIPATWLLVFSLNREGSNFEGISALRPCFGNWLRKNTYLKLNAIGIEKFAVPTPIATIPSGKESSDQTETLKQVLNDYTTHYTNWIIKPEGWLIELNNSNTYDPAKVETSIDSEDKRMAKAFMANFLELGMGTSGSYALSNDLSDFFLSGLEYIANMFCDGINEKLVKRMVDLNYGPQDVYPKLKVSGISDKLGKEFSEMLKNFIDAKVITPDDKLEDSVRIRAGLPERSLEGQRTVEPQKFFSEMTLSERIMKKVKR